MEKRSVAIEDYGRDESERKVGVVLKGQLDEPSW